MDNTKIYSFNLIKELTPSKLARQLRCSKSLLADLDAEYESSEVAERGSLLHSIAEKALKSGEFEYDLTLSDYERELINSYARFIMTNYPNYNDSNVEVSVKNFFNDKKGIIDFYYFNDDTLKLTVIDFKTGRVDVSPINNYQLLAYAINLVDYLESKDPFIIIDSIELGIHQNNYYENTIITYEDLLEYKEVFLETINDIKEGKLKYEVDLHCNYCPNLKECKVAHDYLIEKDLGETPSVNDMVRAIKYFKLLEKKIELYKDDIRTRLEMGESIENVSIRKGRKIEILSNPDNLIDLVESLGLDTNLLYDKKLKSPRKLKEVLKDTSINLEPLLTLTRAKPSIIVK